MKKLLVTGGVLFSILPAMATDLSLSDWHLIDSNTENPTCSGPEGYTGFVNGDVTMAPLYIQQCDPGYYLNATSETQIQEHQDSNEDLDYYYIQACTQCPAGHSCAGVSNPAVVNDSLGVLGLGAECSAGTYAAAGQSSCTACAPGTYTNLTGQSSCTNAQAGYYTPKATLEAQCPYGYRDGLAGTGTSIDACEKIVKENASDNTYCTTKTSPCSTFNNATCTATLDTNNSSIVNGDNGLKKVLFGSRSFDPLCTTTIQCNAGYTTTNLYAWLAAHPESISASSMLCPPSGEAYNKNDPNYLQMLEDCSEMEPGTVKWVLNNAPMNEVHYVTACSDIAPSGMSDLVISASTANITTTSTGTKCWMRNVDLPNQPWFYVTDFYDSVDGVKSHRSCMDDCGGMQPTSTTYLFGSEWPTTGDYAAVPYLLNGLASATDGQNGNPTADVCIVRTVSINWAGVAEPGAAATCTYGESLTVPTPDTNPEGYNFVGWTVGEVTNNNNNQNNNSNEELGNEEPGNEEPE